MNSLSLALKSLEKSEKLLCQQLESRLFAKDSTEEEMMLLVWAIAEVNEVMARLKGAKD